MPIIVTLDVMLARRKMKARDLAAEIGITESNLSLLRTGKVRGMPRAGNSGATAAILPSEIRRSARRRAPVRASTRVPP